MDLLGSAAVLISALTEVGVTIYHGEPEILEQFERQFCFLPKAQDIYSAAGLEEFLQGRTDDLIYDLAEPLGSRLIVFKSEERWVLLGPYVEDEWNGQIARILLARAGALETAVTPFKTYRCKLPIVRRDRLLKAAQLVAERLDNSLVRKIQTVQIKSEDQNALSYPNDYEDSAVVNRRYAIEERIMETISQGDWEATWEAMQKMGEVISDLRFMSSELRDLIASGATFRTLVRMGARKAGLSPVLIDSISQEYAQKMQNAISNKEVLDLEVQVAQRFCAEVRKRHRADHSPSVRLAMDYIGANLSRQLTIEEIARAAGVERHALARAFRAETGMTVK